MLHLLLVFICCILEKGDHIISTWWCYLCTELIVSLFVQKIMILSFVKRYTISHPSKAVKKEKEKKKLSSFYFALNILYKTQYLF